MRNILLKFVEKITGKPRYDPDVKWDKRIWIANIFRAWEYVAGRRYGIRKESATWFDSVGNKLYIRREFYTVEARLAHYEASMRNYFAFDWSSLFFNPQINYRLGAIALDTATSSADSDASPFTWSHTVTGTNPLIVIGVGLCAPLSQPTTTAVSYAAVAATKARGDQSTGTSTIVESSAWLLGNPSTGSNTVSVTATLQANGHGGATSVSYTGAQSSSTADAVNGLTGTTGTGSQSFTVTTVADNCWVFATGINSAAAGPTLAANQTSRGGFDIASSVASTLRTEDTNAAKTPAGGQSMGFTVGGTQVRAWAFSGASFAPTAAAGTVTATAEMTTNTGIWGN